MDGDTRIAETDEDLRRCFEVVRQLRTHLDEAAFLAQVGRQQTEGYLMAYREAAGAVRAVAGFRFLETLFAGKMMYVDDLVTDERARSEGHGAALFDWLVALARREGCAELHLDSGVQRFDAHRFYFRQRMHVASYHFKMTL